MYQFAVWRQPICGQAVRMGTEEAASLQDAVQAIAERYMKRHPKGYTPGISWERSRGVGRVSFKTNTLILFDSTTHAVEVSELKELFKRPDS